jgi:hypothetical protein
MMADGNGPLPMIMIAYQVNQYVLRILLLGKSILVESKVAHVETTVKVRPRSDGTGKQSVATDILELSRAAWRVIMPFGYRKCVSIHFYQ